MPLISPTTIIIFLLSARLTLTTFNFSTYPNCAQPYLYTHAPSSCDYGDNTNSEETMSNECLCTNTNFLDSAADDIWRNCGCEILSTSANYIVGTCEALGVAPTYSAEQIIRHDDGDEVTCQDFVASAGATNSGTPSQPTTQAGGTGSETTSAPNSSPSSSSSSSGEGNALQKESNKIALGVGIGIGLPALLVGIYACAFLGVTRRSVGI
jgi:hypothetical protein